MRAAAFLYPWDVVGDPDAPRRLLDVGVQQVTLASAYHSTRALTPRHPHHRIVTARHSAVLYPPDPVRWRDRELRPYEQQWTPSSDPGGPYAEAAGALSEAGIAVHSWVVLAHNSRLGEDFGHITVRNAYGDRYPWAPCIARPEVREYAVRLAAEAAVREHTRGTELESCGWYGLAHLHAHDKTGGVRLSGAGQYLMSLCFCEVCQGGYAASGADPEELRASVVRALEPMWSGGHGTDGGAADRDGEWAEVRGLLGEEAAGACRTWRARAARQLRREAVGAVREAAASQAGGETDFRVLLHADPAPHRVGSNAGVAPAEAAEDADGVVLPCTGGAAERACALGPFGAVRAPDRFTVAANFTVVSGMGGSPHTLAGDAAHARELGADELRLYHAGLASDADLAAVREALRALPGGA
ncbi:MAG TPA: hypothetical protein VNS49_01970 [Streptomyces sp.]|nr:hypothetical protein [Streptomyces sp.]